MKAHLRNIRRCSRLVDLHRALSDARVRPMGGMEQLEARTVLSGSGLSGFVLSGFGGPADHHDHFEFEHARLEYHEVIEAEGEYAPRPGGDFGPPGMMVLDRGPRGGGPEMGPAMGYRSSFNEAP